MENYDEYTEGMEDGAVALNLTSALYRGQWLILAVPKFWYQYETRKGNDVQKGGLTVEAPYGNEIRVAFPIVEDPTEPIPDDCITVEQLIIARKAAISTVKGD